MQTAPWDGCTVQPPGSIPEADFSLGFFSLRAAEKSCDGFSEIPACLVKEKQPFEGRRSCRVRAVLLPADKPAARFCTKGERYQMSCPGYNFCPTRTLLQSSARTAFSVPHVQY